MNPYNSDWRIAELFAYSIKSPFSLVEAMKELRGKTPWIWNEGDSDQKGPFVYAHVGDPRTTLTLFEEAGRIILNIKYWSNKSGHEAEERWRSVHQEIKERVLPLLNTDDIRREEYFE